MSSYADGNGANAIHDKIRKESGAPVGRRPNNASLANLKYITSETARINQAKGQQSKLLNKTLREEFKLNAKAFQAVMAELPKLSSLDVLRMAVHTAIAKDNWEDAARYAGMLAEFEAPKLQRIESSVTTRASEMTDEELQLMISAEGLVKPSLLGTD